MKTGLTVITETERKGTEEIETPESVEERWEANLARKRYFVH